MKYLNQRRIGILLALILGCGLLFIFVSAGSAAPPAGDEEFSVIADAANAYLNTAPAGVVPGTNYMDTPTLMGILDDNNDGIVGDAGDDPTNDPLVIDVRAQANYEGTATNGQGNGHIPGAIHVATYNYADIVKPANLEYIRRELAKHQNKEIVLACYSGHTDKLAEMALGAVAQAGYFGTPAPEVTALKWGNLGWNSSLEPSVLAEVTPGPNDIYVHTYGVETTSHALPAPGSYPTVSNTSSNEPAEITRVATDANVAPGFIFPGTAAGQVNDTNIGNYTVVDVRSPADYAAGHITGAVNIPRTVMFAKDGGGDYTNLLSIDTSKPVIVYSNGQQEANATSVALNALGIRNASKKTQSLRYGLAAWNYNYGMAFNPNTEEHAYPVVTGSAPGGATYSASCSQTKPAVSLGTPAPFWASFADYTSGILSVNWPLSDSGSIAYDVKLTGSTDNNGVTLASTLPALVSNIITPAGGASTVTLRYNVPTGVGGWHASLQGSATDLCDSAVTYP